MLLDLIYLPWERILFLLTLGYIVYTIAERHNYCQSRVANEQYALQSCIEFCTEHIFHQLAVDCESCRRRLETTYENEAWWQCFWNSFYFYRSWMRILAIPAFFAISIKVWRFLSQPTPPMYSTDLALSLPPYHRRSRRHHSPRKLTYYE